MSLISLNEILAATRSTKSGRLVEATATIQRLLKGKSSAATPAPSRPAATRPADAQFLTESFSSAAGSRTYKLFVPADRPARAPLIVMLHGCTQSPDDFAAGTRMNQAAAAHGALVAYPAQTSAANMQKCWNWFNAADQRRDSGEPALIAGITRAAMRDHAIDPARVYVAGLSAGGAAAAIMGARYPDLYAAIGVHSGLACGAARDMSSAFGAMQRGGPLPEATGRERGVPTIVFHGDRDGTVHASNGDAVVMQAADDDVLRIRVEAGKTPAGIAFTRTLHADSSGVTTIEQWLVHGLGHAWSGGSPDGSYTDPRGPDATAEMLRFFLEHPQPTAK